MKQWQVLKSCSRGTLSSVSGDMTKLRYTKLLQTFEKWLPIGSSLLSDCRSFPQFNSSVLAEVSHILARSMVEQLCPVGHLSCDHMSTTMCQCTLYNVRSYSNLVFEAAGCEKNEGQNEDHKAHVTKTSCCKTPAFASVTLSPSVSGSFPRSVLAMLGKEKQT